jgi:hypothetical protein
MLRQCSASTDTAVTALLVTPLPVADLCHHAVGSEPQALFTVGADDRWNNHRCGFDAGSRWARFMAGVRM